MKICIIMAKIDTAIKEINLKELRDYNTALKIDAIISSLLREVKKKDKSK
jgi:hypothetical protein